MVEPVVGIVAEYNPFHRGHAYHLAQARKETGASTVVAVLSSHFVQRGEPGCLDPQTRTAMALDGGVDLVLELPVPFCCHNAGVFASAAVDILAATGVVTHIAFGMEDNLAKTKTILSILLDEPTAFKKALTNNLDAGLSYIESRNRAVDHLLPGAGAILSRPNNSLALAYVMRILKARHPLEPVAVSRLGPGYHDLTKGVIMSATALRSALETGDRKTLEGAMPPAAFRSLWETFERGRCLTDYDSLWRALRTVLIREGAEKLSAMAEMSEGIEGAFTREAGRSRSWAEFVDRLTSKRYPRGRIQRQLIHCLIGLDHWTNRAFQRLGPTHLRVLGANMRGRALLRTIRSNGSLPVVSRGADVPQGPAEELERIRRISGEIWEGLLPPSAQAKPFPPPLMA